MFSFLFGGFGLSTFWFIPLLWRCLRPLISRRRPTLAGHGTIRFWLGGAGVLLSSAALEGLIVSAFTDDATAGGLVCRTLADAFFGWLGTPITILLMLALLVAALPWYLGGSWSRWLAGANVFLESSLAVCVHLAGRAFSRGSRRGRRHGAVRRTDRPPVRRRIMPTPPSAPLPVGSASPSADAQPPPRRVAAHAQTVIREPWLLPRSAKRVADSELSVVLPRAPEPQRSGTPAIAVSIAPAPEPVATTPASTPLDAEPLATEVSTTATSPITDVPAQIVAPLPEPMLAAALDVMPPPRWASPATGRSIARDAANDEIVTATYVRPAPVSADTRAAASKLGLPPLNLLSLSTSSEPTLVDEANLLETGELIQQRLREFKVPVTVVGASAGPVITRFEVEPAVGVRGNQIVALMKDLARGLGRTSIRVVETIPGKTCMGLELPNEKRQMIALSEILDSPEYRDSDSLLTLAMGKGITGEPVVADLARAPHMLVAGTTGSGKSVAINAMILSLLYKATPEDVRMIMIDPKMLELSVYEGIPHLLAPVVTDMKLAANALNWCVAEMENRYRVMSDLRVRNLAGFNEKLREARASGRPLMNPFPAHPEIPELLDTLPMIVVVIDELADLMMVAGKKIEELIARLAQKARAAGIHLVLATQRPSVDVITGLIKANIPTRVAFQVSSKIDSRTILDQMGAESLLGQGDMLFLPPGTGYPQRIHGAFVADEEVHRVVAWLKQFGEPDYKHDILAGPSGDGSGELFSEDAADAELDPLYDEAAAFVLRSRRASISFVQRQFRIGYNRAARLVEAMEAAGLVSAMGINGQRDVLAPPPTE